jgi:hypothetical protein
MPAVTANGETENKERPSTVAQAIRGNEKYSGSEMRGFYRQGCPSG